MRSADKVGLPNIKQLHDAESAWGATSDLGRTMKALHSQAHISPPQAHRQAV